MVRNDRQVHAVRAEALSTVQRKVSEIRIHLDADSLTPERGTILFGNRLSSVQKANNVAKLPWTHVAIVGDVAGSLATIELGPRGVFSRSIDEFRSAYRYTGEALLAGDERCRSQVATVAEGYLASGTIRYSWSSCALIGAASLLRCVMPSVLEPVTIAAVEFASRALSGILPANAMSCSAFVLQCIASACKTCTPKPVWPRCSAVRLWASMPTVTDLDSEAPRALIADPGLVQLLTNPSDLWVGCRWSAKAVHKPNKTTLIIDHRTDPSPTTSAPMIDHERRRDEPEPEPQPVQLMETIGVGSSV